MEEDIDMNTNKNDNESKKIKLRFRNYQPRCESLKKFCVEPAKYIEIKDEFKELIEKSQNIDYEKLEIAPKKINWDLKREIKPEMDQLNNLTQIALRQIIQEKIDKQNDEESSEYETDDDDDDIDNESSSTNEADN